MRLKLSFMVVLLLSAIAVCQAAYLSAELEEANFKFMLRGYCYAASKITDTQALGGFGESDNFSRPIRPEMFVRRGECYLIARPDEATVFAKKYKGMRLLLINATSKQVAFPASDSRLPIIQEARDEHGEWRPIEYLPSSWCGNSYHRIFLGSNEYWVFAAPRYTGRFKTKLRFKLEGKNPLYSDEFEGRINKEQFSIKRGHTPTDIMDPYNN